MSRHERDRTGWSVAVVGATGLVGRTMISILEERRFPVRSLLLFASERSSGRTVRFRGVDVAVQTLEEENLRTCGADIALFSAGGSVSLRFVPIAAASGMVVIDNSSAFRMNDDVPLVVPEVNSWKITASRRIIANPNCSTIQLAIVLKPLHDRWNVKRVVVATYQSVTGAGKAGVDQLRAEAAGLQPARRAFQHPISGNLIPQIGGFLPDGSTQEEEKMRLETPKILEAPSLAVSATCVRVPVTGGHSEAVTAECERPFEEEEVRHALRDAPGVVLIDDPSSNTYPTPMFAEGSDAVFIGRIRRDRSIPNGLSLWIVSDNLRKGAATNAIQIAEVWSSLNGCETPGRVRQSHSR